ncbi:MAG: hypothetical protein U0V75_14975 [Ferruginibacter sp.]
MVFIAGYFFFAIKFNEYYTPDATLYISIAEHIIHGEFHDAVNAYWSPLISWLLVPFILVLKDGIIAFKVINFLLGFFIITRVSKILDHYGIHALTRNAILISCCLLAGLYSVIYLTADVLLAALLFQYYYLLLKDKLFGNPFLYGITGTAIYLCKAYGLYFFLAHSIVYFFISGSGSKKLPGLLKGLAVFFILCSSWIGILSVKYGHFTISTAGRYNQSIITEYHATLHPADTMRLMPPFPGEKYSAWEEMSLHVHLPSSGNKNAFSYQHIKFNLVQLAYLLLKVPRYFILLMPLLLLVLFTRKEKISGLLLPASLAGIYTSGYLAFFIEERYLIAVLLIILVLQALLIDKAASSVKLLPHFAMLLLLAGTIRYLFSVSTTLSTADETICNSIHRQTKKFYYNKRYVTWRPFEFYILGYMNQWKNYSGIKNYAADSTALAEDLTRYKIDFIIIPDSVHLPLNVQRQYNKMELNNIGSYQLWGSNQLIPAKTMAQ